MSDFSELCPLFSTGCFKEVTFPNLFNLTGFSTTSNFLAGAVTITSGVFEGFSFGRTVVVTGANLRKFTFTADSSNVQIEMMRLRHRASVAAAATNFGSLTVTVTGSIQSYLTWNAMTVTDTTFTSDAILDLGLGTLTATPIGCYDLIVKYKDA